MGEFSVFIAYRGDDGLQTARSVRDGIEGRTIYPAEDGRFQARTVNVHLDGAAWADDSPNEPRTTALASVDAMILVCSPGVAVELSPVDDLYADIRWWLKNRQTPPVLVTTAGTRWIPEIVTARYPGPPTIPVGDPDLVARVLGSLTSLVVTFGDDSPGVSDGLAWGWQNSAGLYLWQKDTNGRYVYVNDNYARMAGYDSSEAMIGKNDDDMPWRELADYFRGGDRAVMDTREPHRIHVAEIEVMVDRVAEILVTESRLESRSGATLGVTGFFLEASAGVPDRIPLARDLLRLGPEAGVRLGAGFGNAQLLGVEAAVLKGILCDLPLSILAERLQLTAREVVWVQRNLMKKLGAQTVGDLIATAIRSGMPMLLFDLQRTYSMGLEIGSSTEEDRSDFT